MAIGAFSLGAERCSVANCLEMDFSPMFFFSKYPEKVSPIWNLTLLLPPLIWLLFFLTLMLVILYFLYSTFIYKKMGLQKHLIWEEIILFPAR